jgi:HK97 family phage prohead protease
MCELENIPIINSLVTVVKSTDDNKENNKKINLIVRGEEFPNELKKAIDFRLYKLFTNIIDCDYTDVVDYVDIKYINNYNDIKKQLPLYTLGLIPIKDNKVTTISESIPIHIKGYIEKTGKDRIIAGYASVIEVDKENQLIPKETLEKGIETLLKDSNYANLMLMHQNIQVGRILNEYKGLKTHVDDKGLYIVAQIRDDIETANQVWNKIDNKDFNGFSIAGEVVLTHRECDDKSCYEVVDKMNIFEVSVCDKPINSKSGFIVISKSEENDYIKNNINVCICKDNLKNIGDSLMKKEETKTPVEEKSEEAKKEIKKEETEQPKEDIEKSNDECKDCEEKSDDEPSEEEEEEESEDEPSEEETKSDEIERLTREIEAIKATLSELTNEEEKQDDEEELPEEESDEGEEYPYPDEKSFDELKKSVDTILEQLSKMEEIDELKKSIKSKDDQINALNKRLEIVEKSEKESKTIIEKSEDETEEEEYNEIVRDNLRPGTLYKSVD